MNEAQTRAQHIAPALALAGWGQVDGSCVLRERWQKPHPPAHHLHQLLGTRRQATRKALPEMQHIIEAEKSDLYDVLAYVAFALPTETRATRADRAKAHNAVTYGQKQQAFLAFVLDQYVTQGVDQLDADKLTPLLNLRYNALNDAMVELGDGVQVRRAFVGMHRYLYQSNA